MSSFQRTISCPKCGKHGAIEDCYWRTGERKVLCLACGYREPPKAEGETDVIIALPEADG